MKLKSLFNEALNRGEQLRDEVVGELLRSQTVQELVGSKQFVQAISRVIETKDEIKHVLGKQIKSVFKVMDIPTREDIRDVAQKINTLERNIDKLGRSKIKVQTLKKTVGKKKKRK